MFLLFLIFPIRTFARAWADYRVAVRSGDPWLLLISRLLVRDEMFTIGIQAVLLMITPTADIPQQIAFMILAAAVGFNSWCRWRDRMRFDAGRHDRRTYRKPRLME